MNEQLNKPETGVAYQQILSMAKKNCVVCEQNNLEAMGEAITNLADNELQHNDSTRALIALIKKGDLTPEEGDQWLLKLAEEMGEE